MEQRRTFLVAEGEALVRLDLQQVLEEVAPGADVRLAESAAGAESVLQGIDRLDGAILGLPIDDVVASGLADRLSKTGCWVICLNGRHVERIEAMGWASLVRPFFAEDAQSLIRSLLRDTSSGTAAG